MMQAHSQALWCAADVALALTSCPFNAGARMAQVPPHLQSWAAGSCTVQDVNGAKSAPLLTFLIINIQCDVAWRNSPSVPPDDAKLVCFSFFSPPSPCSHSPIKTLLILCHSGVFSSAISWPGACASLSLGWVCLVDCSTGTDWHSSWGLQGLHTQSTKHVSVWGAAPLPQYEVGILIYHKLSLYWSCCCSVIFFISSTNVHGYHFSHYIF